MLRNLGCLLSSLDFSYLNANLEKKYDLCLSLFLFNG